MAPDIVALQNELVSRRSALDRLVRQALEIRRIRLQRLAGTPYLRDPRRLILERQQRVDQLEMRLLQLGKDIFQQRRSRIEKIVMFLSAFRPDRLLQAKRAELAILEMRLRRSLSANVEFRKNRVTELGNVIRLLGPQQTLERGYSITLDAKGNVIRSVQGIKTGDRIQTKLADGAMKSVVEEAGSLPRPQIVRDL